MTSARGNVYEYTTDASVYGNVYRWEYVVVPGVRYPLLGATGQRQELTGASGQRFAMHGATGHRQELRGATR